MVPNSKDEAAFIGSYLTSLKVIVVFDVVAVVVDVVVVVVSVVAVVFS